MQDAEIEAVLLRQMPHAGDEGLIKRAIVGPSGKHLVDGRVVDHGGSVICLGYWEALPLHTRIEHPEDQIKHAVIAEFAFRPRLGIDCGKINVLNSGSESLTGIGVVAGLFVIWLIRMWLHEQPEIGSPENRISQYNTTT